jgi:tRNA (cmo5U34)-methyltransferase
MTGRQLHLVFAFSAGISVVRRPQTSAGRSSSITAGEGGSKSPDAAAHIATWRVAPQEGIRLEGDAMTDMVPHEDHDWLSEDYVQHWISTDVTRDAERRPKLRRAAGFLPFDRDRRLRILDIGGGYGEFSAQVLEEFPMSSVVLQDFSPPMVDVAKARLAPYGDRVQYRIADLSQSGWSAALGGPFDAAVSSIAIHNLRRPELIRSLYHEVATVLVERGVFLNLDYIFPSTPLLRDLYWRIVGRSRHADEVTASATLENQLHWLGEAFSESDCIWKDLREVLLCGLK